MVETLARCLFILLGHGLTQNHIDHNIIDANPCTSAFICVPIKPIVGSPSLTPHFSLFLFQQRSFEFPNFFHRFRL